MAALGIGKLKSPISKLYGPNNLAFCFPHKGCDRMKKYEKVYVVFYLRDKQDLPNRWVVEQKPYWRLFKHKDQWLISSADPQKHTIEELLNNEVLTYESSNNLFKDFDSAELSCMLRNQKQEK